MLSAMMYWPQPEWAVTDTGLAEDKVKPFIDHANRVGAAVKLIVFDRPLPLLLERNNTRPTEHHVPETMLINFHIQFNNPDAWWRQSMFEREFV